jgi:DNA-binding transcriptional MocR family regulator
MSATPTIAPENLVQVLGPWDRATGPLKRRLFGALRGAIESGALPSGARLPAERNLARMLGVSRGTVVAAYAALRDDGLVTSRQGSGTAISERPPGLPGRADARFAVRRPGIDALPASARRSAVFRHLLEAPSDTIELLGSHLPACDELNAGLLEACGPELETLARDPGYLPLGLPALRRAIARHLTAKGLPSSEEQILVTNGAQQAIHLLATHFVSRGDAVVVENPTYITGIDVFAGAGARLLTVPVGSDGVDVGAVADALARGGVRLVYVMPTFHNPTGALVPEPARRELAALADRHGVPLVEDDTLADLSLSGEPPPSVGAFARSGSVFSVGSLSKLIWGGLRIGWIRAEESVVLRLARLRIVTDLGSSILGQLLATRLLERAEAITRARRRQAAESLDHLSALLARHLPTWSFARPMGGLSLWVRLPHGDASAFADVALRHGVAVVPGSTASPDRSFADHLRIPFVLGPARMEEGVRRLAAAWDVYAPAAQHRRAALEVIV